MLNKKTLLVLICAISLYVGFVVFSDISILLEKFKNFDFIYLLFSLLLIFISYLIRGIRYDYLLKKISIHLPLKQSVMLFFAGLALGITPGKFGEVIKSSFLKRQYNQSLSKTVPVVFVERYFDLVGIVIIAIVGVWFVEIQKTEILTAFFLMVIVLVVSRQRKLIIPILNRFKKIPFLKNFSNNFLEMYDTIHSLLSFRIYTKSTGLSIIAWLLESIGVFFIFQGFGIDLSFETVVLIFVISSLIGAISMLPGGLGITEGSMIGLLLFQGIDYTEAFSVVLLVRIATLWYSIMLGLLCMRTLTASVYKTEK